MNGDLKKEFQYYLDHQDGFVKEYSGKYIVLKDEQVVVVADTEMEAVEKASHEHKVGTFLVQLVTPGKDAYTQTFHSRVTFA